MKPYVIFDMDGVLIDSEGWYIKKFEEFFQQQGYSIKKEDLIATMGLNIKDIFFKLKAYFQNTDINELAKLCIQYIDSCGSPTYNTIVFPHVKETIKRIYNNGIDIVVASSSPKNMISKALKDIGVLEYIAFFMGREDVEKTKPDSEIYLKILEKKDFVKPLVVVEDSTFGILSAKNAGVYVVAFDCEKYHIDQSQSDERITDHFQLFNILKKIQRKQLAGMIDHTLLKAYASQDDFKKLCQEASENEFAMVAINSVPVRLCKELLKDSSVHVGAAISFPLGQTSIETKVFETQKAIEDGADEIDYVINIGEVKNGHLNYIEEEMSQIVSLCKKNQVISKVIFENCYLTKEEIKAIALIARKVEPDFIKTSTGFGSGGATVEDVLLMKETVGEKVQVKAAGGIRDWAICKAMMDAGASRIGTSSAFHILKEFDELYDF